MYRTVNELSQNELEELKSNYYYELMDECPEALKGIDYPYQMANETVFNHYSGIRFTADDFFCNQ